MQKQQLASRAIALLIAALPIMILSLIGHASAAFFGLLLLGAYLCLARFEIQPTILYFTQYRTILLALFFSPAIVLISGAYQNEISGSDLERSLRLAAGVAIILGATLRISPDLLRQSVWGAVISVWVSLWYVLSTFWANPQERPDLSFIHNAVTFGNLMLLATVITAYSILWNLTRFKRAEFFFKTLTTLAGTVGIVLTQTRGVWLVTPFFVLIGAMLVYRSIGWKHLFISTGLALILILGVFAANPVLRERIVEGQKEVAECLSTNPLADNSLCIRLQLWRASLLILKEHPLLGSGASSNFPNRLQAFAEQNVVSHFVANEFGEPHSEIMQSLSAYGVLGFFALMLVYIVPGFLFLKRLRRSSAAQAERGAAAMGLALCSSFFIFGLSELMFRNMHVVSYYAVLMAWLLALSDPNHQFFSSTNPAAKIVI